MSCTPEEETLPDGDQADGRGEPATRPDSQADAASDRTEEPAGYGYGV